MGGIRWCCCDAVFEGESAVLLGDLTMFCHGVAQEEKGILQTGLDDVWIK